MAGAFVVTHGCWGGLVRPDRSICRRLIGWGPILAGAAHNDGTARVRVDRRDGASDVLIGGRDPLVILCQLLAGSLWVVAMTLGSWPVRWAGTLGRP